jgi:tetratricopeptide (TPR) repeat protein
VRHPDGFRAGESESAPVSVADLAPTIVEALRLGAAAGVDGLSLHRRAVPRERGVYFECYAGWLDYGWSPLAGWLDRDGKYLASSAPELYDLEGDPGETRNLLPAREDERARYERSIAELAARPALPPPDAAPIPGELARRLEELGYAGAGAGIGAIPGPLERLDLPSPAERTAELHALLQATALVADRAFEEATSVLEGIVRSNPRNRRALDQLGFALLQLGRHEEARASLERRLALGSPRAETHLNLALALAGLERKEAALAHLRAALALDPGHELAGAELERLERD